MKAILINTTKSTAIVELITKLEARDFEVITVTNVRVQESVYFASLVYPLSLSAAQVAKTAAQKRGAGDIRPQKERREEAQVIAKRIKTEGLFSEFVENQAFLVAATPFDALPTVTIQKEIPQLQPVLGISGIDQLLRLRENH